MHASQQQHNTLDYICFLVVWQLGMWHTLLCLYTGGSGGNEDKTTTSCCSVVFRSRNFVWYCFDAWGLHATKIRLFVQLWLLSGLFWDDTRLDDLRGEDGRQTFSTRRSTDKQATARGMLFSKGRKNNSCQERQLRRDKMLCVECWNRQAQPGSPRT